MFLFLFTQLYGLYPNPWYTSSTAVTNDKLLTGYSSANAIAVGTDAKSITEGSISLGANAQALQQKSTAIGVDSSANGWNSIAMGTGATVTMQFDTSSSFNDEKYKSDGAIAIGERSSANLEGSQLLVKKLLLQDGGLLL